MTKFKLQFTCEISIENLHLKDRGFLLSCLNASIFQKFIGNLFIRTFSDKANKIHSSFQSLR